jgi:hypothetical protein
MANFIIWKNNLFTFIEKLYNPGELKSGCLHEKDTVAALELERTIPVFTWRGGKLI